MNTNRNTVENTIEMTEKQTLILEKISKSFILIHNVKELQEMEERIMNLVHELIRQFESEAKEQQAKYNELADAFALLKTQIRINKDTNTEIGKD